MLREKLSGAILSVGQGALGVVDGLEHFGQRIGVIVAFIFLELHGPGEAGELGGKDRLHSVTHVHALACDLFQRVGN